MNPGETAGVPAPGAAAAAQAPASAATTVKRAASVTPPRPLNESMLDRTSNTNSQNSGASYGTPASRSSALIAGLDGALVDSSAERLGFLAEAATPTAWLLEASGTHAAAPPLATAFAFASLPEATIGSAT